MKKFLWILVLLGAKAALAQSLFPELAAFGGREKQLNPTPEEATLPTPTADDNMPEISALEISEESEIAVDSDVSADVAEPDLFVAQPAQEEVKAQPKEEAVAEEETKDEEQQVVIYMAAAKSIMPPGRNASYCYGKIKFYSTFRKPVQSLDVAVTYGDYRTAYQIRNLKKGVEQEKAIGLVGEDYQYIMYMPQIEISRCVIEGISEEKCKAKVSFLPLQES